MTDSIRVDLHGKPFPDTPTPAADARETPEQIVRRWLDCYPEWMFPNTGTSSDAIAGRMARHVCKGILADLSAPPPASDAAEIQRLKAVLEQVLPLAQSGAKQLEDAYAENDRLREALEFYAMPGNWARRSWPNSAVECDNGIVARAALAAAPPTTGEGKDET